MMNQALEKKLAELLAVENDVPAVMIVHDIKTMEVVFMSSRGLRDLGIQLQDLQTLGNNYHQTFFNPEDIADYLPKIRQMIELNDEHYFISYFQQVRPSVNHPWQWYMSTSKILLKDENGLPAYSLTIACPIDAQHHITSKVNRLLEENNFLRQNQAVFAALTKKEIAVLKLIATGHSSKEIAEKLFISEHTSLTHRRNIRTKLAASSDYDITRFAQAFNLI